MLLGDCEELSSWERAARQLAELQAFLRRKVPRTVREPVARTLRLPKLIKLVIASFARMADVVRAHKPKQPPDPLTQASLAFLGERLKEACALLCTSLICP